MASYTIQTIEESKTQGKFVFTPLQNRFGTTMGNALRRVLLSSLPGGSVFSIRIDGIYHEFTGVEGVKEDAATIILNIKQLLLKIDINDNDVENLEWTDFDDIENLLSYDNLRQEWNKVKIRIKSLLDNDGKLSASILTDLGICPTCYDKQNNRGLLC